MYINNRSNDDTARDCHAKISPPKNRSGWTDFGKTPAKVVPWTTFAAKIGPAGPILAAKIGLPCQFWSPRGTDFGKKLSAKIGPPSLLLPTLATL